MCVGCYPRGDLNVKLAGREVSYGIEVVVLGWEIGVVGLDIEFFERSDGVGEDAVGCDDGMYLLRWILRVWGCVDGFGPPRTEDKMLDQGACLISVR